MGRYANNSRREFLRKLGCSFAAGSVASLVPQLAFLPRAMPCRTTG